jgi:gamma-glutamyl:cysteine ligase YbdK (ATP-grasp superfamily)
MGKSASNENILKLRELTQKMCKMSNEKNCEDILKEVKVIVDEGSEEIKVLSSTQTKIKCYENMCTNIITILNSIKL